MQVSAYPHALCSKLDLRAVVSDLHIGPNSIALEFEKHAFDDILDQGHLFD